MPKPKKKTVKQLKKIADQTLSKYVRLRDNGICITCRRPGNQAGHFISRRYNATRYNEENVNCQCMQCNVMEHGAQYKYGIELDLKYGIGTAQKLLKMAQEVKKFKTWELEEIIANFEELLLEFS